MSLSLDTFLASFWFVLSSLDELGAPLRALDPGRPPLGVEHCLPSDRARLVWVEGGPGVYTLVYGRPGPLGS